MRLYHEKTDKKLRRTWASRQGRASHLPVAETIDTHRPEEIEPITGQFDDEDLDHDVFDPLETPMTTPVQDEGQASIAPPESQSATSSQEVGNAPTSQAKRSYLTFTSALLSAGGDSRSGRTSVSTRYAQTAFSDTWDHSKDYA